MKKFNEHLKKLRKEKNLTQTQISELIDVKQGTYSRWESGKLEPNFENLSMLACIFDVSIDFLLSEYLEISKEAYLKLKEEKKNLFSVRLKELRLKKRGLTQQQIADEIGVNRGSYSNWEKGKREPSFENLVKLADLLEVSLDSLFGRE